MNLVDPEMAAQIARNGFPDEGGYRICRPCKKEQKISLEQVTLYIYKGIERCKLCGGPTEMMSPDEHKRYLEGMK